MRHRWHDECAIAIISGLFIRLYTDEYNAHTGQTVNRFIREKNKTHGGNYVRNLINGSIADVSFRLLFDVMRGRAEFYSRVCYYNHSWRKQTKSERARQAKSASKEFQIKIFNCRKKSSFVLVLAHTRVHYVVCSVCTKKRSYQWYGGAPCRV